MIKYTKATDEDIQRDPSLRFNDYLYMELVWSDTHKNHKRFVRYVGKDRRQVKLANENWHVLDGTFPIESIRRPS